MNRAVYIFVTDLSWVSLVPLPFNMRSQSKSRLTNQSHFPHDVDLQQCNKEYIQ